MYPPSGADVSGTLIIRNEEGKMIAGFDPAPISFHFDQPPSGTAATSAITVQIESTIDNAAFVVGETYTLYFKADTQPTEIIT
ncbi:MAG: hypothetical protein AABX02_03070, partial [archaeon]